MQEAAPKSDSCGCGGAACGCGGKEVVEAEGESCGCGNCGCSGAEGKPAGKA